MILLVLNCGSSSVKYQLFNMEGEQVLAKGLVERIGLPGAVMTHQINDQKFNFENEIPNHTVAVGMVLKALTDKEHGVIEDMSVIEAVGHRIVHGGEKFTESALITPEVLQGVKDCIYLAPLHNPAHVMGIEACLELMPNVDQVVVFDTAFHQTMPKASYTYALPQEYYEKYAVRRYGAHGTSHKYVAMRAAEMLGKKPEEVNVITCHLGNGSSITAVKDGKCYDTSMGFTPLAGLVMGTRCGDIDPAIVPFLMEKEGLSSAEMDNIMNKKSGVLAVSGVSSDFRDIENAAKEGNERAQLALDVFIHVVKKHIGAYMAELNRVDAIVFTAGLGENGISFREKICANMDFLGVKIDAEKNNVRGEARIISTDDSKVAVMLIPTNEELMIARDTERLVKGK